MDVRQLTPQLSVSPQIAAADMAELAALGFRSVIDNRPDAEIGPEEASSVMAEAAAAAGLAFAYLPFSPMTGMTADLRRAFAEAMAMPGPILAYCRSGTRSANLWAATQRDLSPGEVVAAGAAAGYDLSGPASLPR